MAGPEVFANQPQTVIVSGGTTAPAGGTQESWTPLTPGQFPAADPTASPATFFRVCDPAQQTEKILVTDSRSTPWTVTRGAEGTTPVAHSGSGFTVEQVITAGTMQGIAQVASLFNNRGAIQGSTVYNPGDLIAYKGQHVLITTQVTSTAQSNWFTFPSLTTGTYVPIDGKGVVYAADWGVVSDTVTDNAAALTKALYWGALGAGGGIVILPPGGIGSWIYVSKTIIIPPSTVIVGHGIEDTYIKLMPGSNCDVFQFSSYGSSSQETILSGILGSAAPSQFSIRNAFYSGLMNLCIDGNYGAQAAGSYNYGLYASTNPTGSEAPTDPNYDPTNFLANVEITRCTGDGYNQFSSRGQMRVTDCLFRSNQGWGTVSGTDTIYTGNNWGFNGLGGILVPHSSASGAAAKIYNNGTISQWVSGTAYAALARVTYSGQLYGCLNAVTSATPPSSDTVNWVHITAATGNFANAVSIAGTGLALVSATAQQCTWSSVGFQTNSGSDIYLQGAKGVRVTGNSNIPNWNQAGAVQNATNPNNYASVVLDNSVGNMIDLGATQVGNAYLIRNINGSTGNDIRIAGDATWAAVTSPDSAALTGNRVVVNGTTLADGAMGAAGGIATLDGLGHLSTTQAVRPVLYAPTGLRRWRTMLGDALFTQVPVVCVGDSITAGQGGDNNTSTFSNVPDNTNGWVGQLRTLLGVQAGTSAGEGFIFADDSRVTLAGGTSNNNWACVPLRHGPRLLHGSGNTLALTIPAGVTSLGVIQANETQAFNAAGSNLADVSALYSQAGSTTVTNASITTLTNTGLPVETLITCQAGDVITISAPATAQSYIVGFDLRTGSPGVLVHRVGQPGYVSGDLLGGQTSGTLLQSASNANQVTAARAVYDWAGTQGLVIVSFGVNDQSFQQGGGTAAQNDVTLSLYTTWMEQFASQAIADGWCCLVLGEPRSPSPGAGATLDQYFGAMQSFALATDHVSYMDVGELWGSNTAASALNLAVTNSVHPLRRGHGDIARMIMRAVGANSSGVTELTVA